MRYACLLLLCSWFCCALPATAAAPRVLATIKPVHSLAAGVMAGVARPALLIEGGASPHSYSLRPSDARKLADAQLIIRVGADFETFLNRPLSRIAGQARVLALDRLPGILLLPARRGGLWEEPEHGHSTTDSHAEDNLHLWLDPDNARVIVAGIAAELTRLDPEHAGRYRANATALDRRLEHLDRELQRQLAPVANVPYFVFHDAFPYFERHYHLHPLGALTVSPDRPPGARRLVEIRDRIRQSGVRCVFSEPQFEPKLARLITEGTSARNGTLDPLGADLPPGPDAYFQLMTELGDHLAACLGQPAP